MLVIKTRNDCSGKNFLFSSVNFHFNRKHVEAFYIVRAFVYRFSFWIRSSDSHAQVKSVRHLILFMGGNIMGFMLSIRKNLVLQVNFFVSLFMCGPTFTLKLLTFFLSLTYLDTFQKINETKKMIFSFSFYFPTPTQTHERRPENST